jgi:DNA-binding NtrC family response regulator
MIHIFGSLDRICGSYIFPDYRKTRKEVAVGLSVLIVDDNSGLAYFTAYSLKQELEDLAVVTAGSCGEARSRVNDRQPSVLIVDLELPDGNGLDLVSDLKNRFPAMIPILITATPLSADVHKDLFGVLIKPYDPETLIELVRRALKRDRSHHEAPIGKPDGEKEESSSNQYDFHHVQNRLSGLLAGIRALRLELQAVADDPSEVRRTVDEYSDRLSTMVKEASEGLKRRI